MKKVVFFMVSLLMFFSQQIAAQTIDALKQKIQQIVATKNAIVGVSVMSKDGNDTLSMNGDRHFPLQSVFKFHIALTVLSQVDKGMLSLDQEIKIDKKDLLPDMYSPIRDKYPDGGTLTLSAIIDYTVLQSDNVGCDILLRLIGGPAVVEQYLQRNNFKEVSIKFSEEVQHRNWDNQFQNWTTPKEATAVLKTFYENKTHLLSKKSYDFIWEKMKETGTGKARLKGQLPEKTVVAHKTGTSDTNKEGVTAAVNDIGIVFLPNGNYFFVSVFVSNSKEDSSTNEKIIADIAKAAWDYFGNKTN